MNRHPRPAGRSSGAVRNRDTYEALSPEEREWIDEAADSALSVAGAMAFERVDTEALELARGVGVEIV